MYLLYKKGDIIEGIITNVTPYGGFVHVDYQTNGLIHISEITNSFIEDIHHYLKVGQKVYCRVVEVDEVKHQLRLTLKNVPKNARPRTQRRKRLFINKKILLPQNNIGFLSLEEALPKWIKEEHDDKV